MSGFSPGCYCLWTLHYTLHYNAHYNPVCPSLPSSHPPCPLLSSPPSSLPVFLLFSMRAQAGRRACSRQVSWHAAPHPLPFVSTSGQPFSTSAVSVNIYWPSFSSPPPLMLVCFCPLYMCMCVRVCVYTLIESYIDIHHLLLPCVRYCPLHNSAIPPPHPFFKKNISHCLSAHHPPFLSISFFFPPSWMCSPAVRGKKRGSYCNFLLLSPSLQPYHDQSSCTGESEGKNPASKCMWPQWAKPLHTPTTLEDAYIQTHSLLLPRALWPRAREGFLPAVKTKEAGDRQGTWDRCFKATGSAGVVSSCGGCRSVGGQLHVFSQPGTNGDKLCTLCVCVCVTDRLGRHAALLHNIQSHTNRNTSVSLHISSLFWIPQSVKAKTSWRSST